MTYRLKTKPYEHQKKALVKSKGHEAFAFLMAMRTGKTKVDLDDFGRLEDAKEVQDHLVIAPTGVYRTWQQAIDDHCPDELRERMLVHTWETGGGVGHKRAAEIFLKTKDKRRPRTLLMSLEALSSVDRARELAVDFVQQRSNMGSVDESVTIKNPAAKRTKFIIRELAPHIDYRRILSGLPTPRSPLDLYPQFEFLDWRILGFRSYYSFRARYAILRRMDFGGRKVDIVVGYQNTEELYDKIDPYSFRVPFRPKIPSTYSIREVKLSKEQERVYREIKENAMAKLSSSGTYVSAQLVITQILRLHQVLCGHVKDEFGNVHSIPENRTDELLAVLEDYAGKAVIWCSYDEDVRKIATALLKEYGENSVARFWGGNVKTREAEAKQFMERDETRFMIATPNAGRYGRTWTNADLVIYYSSTGDLDHRDQSEMRVMGVDKERQVDIIDLVVPHSVDIKNLEALRKKIDMSAVITGDNYREWLI